MKEIIRYLQNRSMKPHLESMFTGISNSRKKALDNWFHDQWLKIDALVKALQSNSDDNAKTEELLQETVAQGNDFLEAFILDSTGSVILSSFASHRNLDYSQLPNYIKGMNNEAYMYGPFSDHYTLDIPINDKIFADEVTLIFSQPYLTTDETRIFCVRILNDDMSNIIQEEKSHVFKETGDNYLFMIKNSRGVPAGTAISRSRFEDKTFTLGDNLKDGIRTKRWGTVKIKAHTEFEICFTDPATGKLHQGIQNTIQNGENLNCWPGYPDYRHVLVGGKGTVIIPPHSDEIWGMMCEADILELYKFNSINTTFPIINTAFLAAALSADSIIRHIFTTPVIACNIVLLILMFLCSLLLTKHLLTKPINSTVSVLRDLAEGEADLTHRVQMKSGNEIGELARWFNKFMHNQKHMIKRIRNALKLTKTSLKQVSSASQRIEKEITDIKETIHTLSENSIEQNALFSNTKAEVKKISDSFKHDNELNILLDEIKEKTQITSTTSANAKTVTSEVENSIQELEQSMENALGSIEHLSSQSEQITAIVSTIANISRQTNLLALNASIEAARAGDAGKGFAVVANEIKSLSLETQTATTNISDLIHSIQQEIQSTDADIILINEKMQNSIQSTRESTKAVDLVIDVSKSMTQIVDIMEQQNKVIREVRHNISSMIEQSDESLAIGEESTQIAKDRIESITKQTYKLEKVLEGLTGSSKDLEEIVNSFILE